eukprot:TRINITY_DN10321_c0_g1_i6.p2 TRINITY_DN10321_c0_g1~~TRINITY_DN10321_c0_g1_i6.p2  ORF type:complete len:128 (-),score=11.27 TRINITY_DN10321_c0_g1_i6:54-437(-)
MNATQKLVIKYHKIQFWNVMVIQQMLMIAILQVVSVTIHNHKKKKKKKKGKKKERKNGYFQMLFDAFSSLNFLQNILSPYSGDKERKEKRKKGKNPQHLTVNLITKYQSYKRFFRAKVFMGDRRAHV